MINRRLKIGAPAMLAALLLTVGCVQGDSPASIDADGAAAASAVPDFSGVWMAFTVESPNGGNQPRYCSGVERSASGGRSSTTSSPTDSGPSQVTGWEPTGTRRRPTDRPGAFAPGRR
jgi:hypothetical protein